ncbi:uncharacterized protein ColSpa_09754 [Colletotrichum spaethianum]|uniref:Uncharacterized protein n=1 Tax=Colletotrichum spaethianum TaxID=700344 RepID=A0AA37PC89_9PEZI|nr:uncharacterized protein ColSpa_09754 [Colletotrichum spaethianum]GKT49573.1 hypothetical protein ColSpa_09754 [Colletotrichum spaethianum]
MFLLANLTGIRDERIIAWILKQYEEKTFQEGIKVVVEELQPEVPKQSTVDATEAAAVDSSETNDTRHNNKKKGKNKGPGKNKGSRRVHLTT